ncbi:hypothetical protein TNCV_1435761 [Trichonephila clavipes]|nr:hypothetical protein TNCV_1435761 [Trichonephila clavipes]
MFDPSSFADLTPLAHADTSRDVLPRGGSSQSKKVNMTAEPHPMTVRKQATVKKVKSLILKENPLIQKLIAANLGTSSGTVNEIIRKDLKLKKMFKPQVHLLLPKYIAERKTNCRKSCEKHLSASLW